MTTHFRFVGAALAGAILSSLAHGATQPVISGLTSASAFGGFIGKAAPGSYVEIYGTNLAGSTRGWVGSDFNGSAAPTSLDGVTVTVNGVGAYINYVSPGQVNIEVPDGVPLGSVPVVLSYQGQSSAAANLTINAQQPGLLTPVHGASGAYVTPALPAALGETLIFFGTGFGMVTGTPVAGKIASGQTSLAAAFTMTIGGVSAPVQYAGLAPGLVGVYQFNVVVPLSLSTGTAAIRFTLGGAAVNLQTLSLPIGSATPGAFTVTSSAGKDGGLLPADYTCDGTGSTLPLAWSNVPSGTKEFAVLMTTLPGDGTKKWNWVIYHIPPTTTNLAKDSFLIGTLGVGSDGPGTVYNPPCSQGPGPKLYTYTVYALSDALSFSVPTSQVTGQMVTDAISPQTLASASLNLSFTRTTTTGSSTNCGYINSSTRASRSGTPTVACDGTYAYVGSTGIITGSTTNPMMNGITSTNLQVPVPQNFQGANGWKIPLNPIIAASPTTVVDGPIGVAINGLPIFNPCTQGGCVTGGDTKVLGQLDTCNGHTGRADDYHYHAAPTCMMADQPATYWDTHPLGWALDGFAIFGYHDADGSLAMRDNICGGNTKPQPNAPQGYSYHVTDASPYVTSCLIGVPSPDLPNQGAKYHPLRQPPVTPFVNSGMTLTTDPTDGYQVLQFTSALAFTTNETGSDSYRNLPGTYRIRYKQVTGADLVTLLALKQNGNASACWNFQFVDVNGTTTQPTVSYCK